MSKLHLQNINASVEKIGSMFLFCTEGVRFEYSQFAVQNIYHIQLKKETNGNCCLIICSKERSYNFGLLKPEKHSKLLDSDLECIKHDMRELLQWLKEVGMLTTTNL